MKNKSLSELFDEISKLSKIDKATPAEMLCKLAEEFGEIAQAINKTIGRKSNNLSEKEKRAGILEEGADVLQNLICLVDKYGITLSELVNMLSVKNKKWEKVIKKRNKKRIIFGKKFE